MKKILKISLFIIVFCSLLLFSSSKVQAKLQTVTTVQELQEVMGATAYSTIDGTTIKITNDFTWTLTNDVDIKIPELTIDFNENEIKIHNIAILSTIRIEGKVIFKDSQGEKGGIYCNSIIEVNEGSELIIENGQYTAARERVNVRNNGGTIIIKNGIFKSNDNVNFFDVRYGKMMIYNGRFEGNGVLIYAIGNFSGTEVIIEGGSFKTENAPAFCFSSYCSPLKVTLGNCSISSKNSDAINIGDAEYGLKEKLGDLILDGCYIEGDEGAISLNPRSIL